jgi:hypothetical protein
MWEDLTMNEINIKNVHTLYRLLVSVGFLVSLWLGYGRWFFYLMMFMFYVTIFSEYVYKAYSELNFIEKVWSVAATIVVIGILFDFVTAGFKTITYVGVTIIIICHMFVERFLDKKEKTHKR